PSLAVGGDGTFVVTWSRVDQLSGYGSSSVHSQRFDAAGVPEGNNVQVSESPVAGTYGLRAALSIDEDNSYVVAWGNDESLPSAGVKARGFTSDGTAMGGEVVIASNGSWPSIARTATGRFVAVWQDDSILGQELITASSQP